MSEKLILTKELKEIFNGINVDLEYFAFLLKRAKIRRLKNDFQKGKYQPDLKALSERIIWEEVWEDFYFNHSNKEQD